MKQLNSHNFEEVYKKLKIDLDTLGCVMLDVDPTEEMKIVPENFPPLYFAKNKERKWINGWIAGNVAHVTLLYGLLDNAHNMEKEISQVLDGWKMDSIEIDHVGFFDSPYEDEPYYCLIAHVKVTDELMEGHNRLEFLPHINTFTGYAPHMTICYIDKGIGEGARDEVINKLNEKLSGKKLDIRKNINLGYEPKKETV